MKLRSKLYISFSVLFFFFLLAAGILILQIREHDRFITAQVQKNISQVIDLSTQQQLLEKVYARFLSHLISQRTNRSVQPDELDQAMLEYERNWRFYLDHGKQKYVMNRLLRKLYHTTAHSMNNARREQLETACSDSWFRFRRDVLDAGRSDAGLSADAQRYSSTVRDSQATLLNFLQENANTELESMRRFGYRLQQIISGIAILLLILSIVTALILARSILRPLAHLRGGIEQMAVQDFDIDLGLAAGDELGDLARDFEQLARRLKEVDAYKAGILSQFSHEMKSPLGAIKQATRLLEGTLGEEVSRNQQQLLSIIRGNNDTLHQMISRILDTARFEDNQININTQNSNIVKLMSQNLVLLAPVIKERGLRVKLNYASEKIECETDQAKMGEVFQNLISNAVKFSPSGKLITVSISYKLPVVTIKIKDEGIGIPKAEIPYIFEKMYRASNSKKTSVKGTGLGLYIAAQIIRSHKGKISVTSIEGSGTEFILQLPKTQAFSLLEDAS
jgi:signal transduction histidine kinase